MDNVEKWFKEVEGVTPIHETKGGTFIIYKGFKISFIEGVYHMYDVRFSNLYTSVVQKDLNLFSKHGFIKGADIINYNRNSKRVLSYKKRTEILYDKRAKFKKEMPKNPKLNQKRIKNINIRIRDYVDQMFLYQNRIQDFNNKYKDYENTSTIA
jgi:hypothetical protein